MNRIDKIKKHLSSSSNDGEAHATIFTADDVQYLLNQLETLRSAALAAEKHINGTAKIFSHRNKTAVLDQLNRALEPYRIEPERGGLVNPDGGDYPLKWMSESKEEE